MSLGLRQVLPLTKVWDWHKQRRQWRGLAGQRPDVAAAERKRGIRLATRFGDFATDGRCRKARYYGIAVNDRSLTPGDHPRIGPTRFADWLSRPAPRG